MKSTPPVQLLVIKESLIDYPLDMEDITDMKNNPILHSSEVFIMGFTTCTNMKNKNKIW